MEAPYAAARRRARPLSDAAPPVTVYLGLGSNLGDRLARLRAAVVALEATEGLAVARVSSVYESAAHTLRPGERQPPYLNAVVEARATLAPPALLAACHAAEAEAGRRRAPGARWQPRPLDVDVLLYGALRLAGPDVQTPHPRLAERRFVLEPLCELAPGLVAPPPLGRTVAALLAACPDAAPLRRLPERL